MASQFQSTLVDLREVRAPYVRLMGKRQISMAGNGTIQQWELRLTQPNRSHLSAKAMHSLEHLLAKYIQRHLPNTLEVSPMACATGFRLLIVQELEFEEFVEALSETLEDILESTKVPAAEEWRCGQVELHSLDEAQQAAANFLAEYDSWGEVVPLAK